MKKIILLFTLFLSIGLAHAQKLPNVQSGGQLLPAKISIDGKLNEWPNGLNAYNKALRIEYVLANNDNYLYLAIRTKDVGTTAKILAGGLTLNINTSGKKSDNGPTITFPLTNSGYTISETGATKQNFKVLVDSSAIVKAIKELNLMKVNHLPGVQDSVLSIYNVEGIKAKMLYDNTTLVCEMMIPKKLLGLVDLSTPFAYHLKLDGVVKPYFTGGAPPPPLMPNPKRSPTHISNITAEISVPTGFWGEYAMAKQTAIK